MRTRGNLSVYVADRGARLKACSGMKAPVLLNAANCTANAWPLSIAAFRSIPFLAKHGNCIEMKQLKEAAAAAKYRQKLHGSHFASKSVIAPTLAGRGRVCAKLGMTAGEESIFFQLQPSYRMETKDLL
jgi:hypothetical protein